MMWQPSGRRLSSITARFLTYLPYALPYYQLLIETLQYVCWIWVLKKNLHWVLFKFIFWSLIQSQHNVAMICLRHIIAWRHRCVYMNQSQHNVAMTCLRHIIAWRHRCLYMNQSQHNVAMTCLRHTIAWRHRCVYTCIMGFYLVYTDSTTAIEIIIIIIIFIIIKI